MRLAFLTLVLACGCAPSAAPPAASGVELGECRLPGAGRMARCGTVEVLEDRARGEGRKLPLHVVVLKAGSAVPAADPLLLLAGGPGQAATEAFGPMLGLLAQIGNDRDLVLVDIRGTGRSAPLDCPLPSDLASLMTQRLDDFVDRCKGELTGGSSPPDLTRYTTATVADDLDQVRAALGYQQVNLLGISYGTRLAMVYARRHPERVRSMVLDAVAPYELVLSGHAAVDAQRALEKVARECSADTACLAGNGDPLRVLAELLARLRERPAQIDERHPRTGLPLRFELDADAFLGVLRGMLYVPELAALVPRTIKTASQGDYRLVVAQADYLLTPTTEQMSHGLLLGVACAEDVPRLTEQMRRESAATLFGSAMIDELTRACARWPHAAPAELPAGFAEPTTLQTPALILSGAYDPVTPPRWGEAALKSLPRGRHVVVPEGSHGSTVRGCVAGLVRRFLDAGKADGLDTECVRDYHRPRPFVDFYGTAP